MPEPFTFEKAQTVEKLDTVPEHYRSMYAENSESGGFTLIADNEIINGATKGIDTLSKALASERLGRKADAKKMVDLAPLSQYGDSVETISAGVTAAIEDLNTKIKNGDVVKADSDAIKLELGKIHQTEIGKRDTREKTLRDQIYDLTVTNQANAAIVEHGGEEGDLINLALQQFVREVEVDGKIKIVVVDEEGHPRFAQNKAGEAVEMSISQKVEEMKLGKYAKLFKSTTKDGTGVNSQDRNQRRTTTTQIPTKRSDMTPVQKIASGLGKKQHSNA